MPTDAPPTGEWLNTAETAAALGVSRWTVYNLCESGDLPHHTYGPSRTDRNGRRVTGNKRFKREDIDAYLERSRRHGEPVAHPMGRAVRGRRAS